ncbi:hypothetical protein [Micromonospora inyonensis]|uniref:Uncharacterized protein n=1 Tax=Micromonospora inyonensis TaxID=47866 RepID=A0A1C6S9D9_9ACTN|nr:hypothetical protein [Micromonospora inyonensis]SCL25892.1 hypothetical protein GA0074694_4356 [Micromonospora inyonensis]
MTETETDIETEIVARVPVHYHGEYTLNVENDYEHIYQDDSHDNEHLEGLGDKPGATTALYAVASARYLSEKTGVLGDVLREPYTLRTTRDVEAVEVAVPADLSPALDMDALIAGVIEQLRARGIEVTEVHVFEWRTVWELGEGRHLSLSREGSWDLASPTGDGSTWTPAWFGLTCWYAHPEQIADLAAKELAEVQA